MKLMLFISTPKNIKFLIWVTALISLLSPVISFILMHYFNLPGPGLWLSLSLWGIKQGFAWQPLTYFFIQSVGMGISLSLLFSLLFHLFFLWFAGSEVHLRFGAKSFFLFYFGAGIFSGLVSLLSLFLFSSSAVIAGCGPCVYALLVVWMLLYPDLQIFFLIFMKIKVKWLVILLLGLLLFIDLSYGQFFYLLADLSGMIWGFMIGRFVWKLPNPFPLNLPSKSHKQGGKIIDISVFQEDDEAFMDRMLEKIAKKGEGSLTKRERERMEKISKKRG